MCGKCNDDGESVCQNDVILIIICCLDILFKKQNCELYCVSLTLFE